MYWFRAKTYGWGWTPSTWQGWTVTAVWTAALAAWVIYRLPVDGVSLGWHFDLLTVAGGVLLAAVFFGVCWLKGEPLTAWRWGR
jgi:hypothetical protein